MNKEFRGWKKFLKGLLITSACVTMTMVPVYGADIAPEDVPPASEISAEDTASDSFYVRARGNYLNYGTSTITKIDSRTVNVYGLTTAHRVCDALYLDSYLEQYKGGSWNYYYDWSYEATNTYSLSRSRNYVVQSGYYYRAKGTHTAIYQGTNESDNTTTLGILVK